MKEQEESHKDGLEKIEQDHNEEVSALKSFANDIKARFNVYIPNKQDAIDVKLGTYMNNYPDKRKLKFTFIRQAQGSYVFGTRLVTVKVDGTSIHVKTDGRSIPIGEFIDEITPKELLKFENRNPILRSKQGQADSGSRDVSPAAFGDTLTVDIKSNAGKSMRRQDSKATVRTSMSKTPLKKRGH